MQSAGFYYRSNVENNWGPIVFNTFVGDPARLVLLEAILNFSEKNHLIQNAEDVNSINIKKYHIICNFI